MNNHELSVRPFDKSRPLKVSKYVCAEYCGLVGVSWRNDNAAGSQVDGGAGGGREGNGRMDPPVAPAVHCA